MRFTFKRERFTPGFYLTRELNETFSFISVQERILALSPLFLRVYALSSDLVSAHCY